MIRSITNSDDIIDSRDVIKRMATLEQERADLALTVEDWDAGDDGQELAALKKLTEDCSARFVDWVDGIVLINDDYFEEYAQDYARDSGDDLEGWPYDHIDWEAAADALRQDYRAVDFDGQTFLTRG